MADLVVFARQSDVSRACNKTQRRPLSIITENDSDEPESAILIRHDEREDIGENVNICVCEDVSESNQNSQGIDTSEISHQTRLSSISQSVSSNNEHSDSSVLANICECSSSSSTAKSINSTYQVCSSEPGLPMTGHNCDYQTGTGSVLPDVASSRSFTEVSKSLRLMTSDTDNFKQKHVCKCGNIYNNDSHAKSNNTQMNIAASTRSFNSDYHNMTKLLATTERPTSTNIHQTSTNMHQTAINMHQTATNMHQTATNIPQTSTSTTSTIGNSKFGNRLWTQSSTLRTLQQKKNSIAPNFHHVSLTSNGSTPLVMSVNLIQNPESDDFKNTISSKLFPDLVDSSNIVVQSSVNFTNIFSNSKLNATKLSSYFSRRMSNESVGSLSESDLSDGDITSDEGSQNYLSYFRRLQDTTDRLRLPTRRPSIMLWRKQYMEGQGGVGRVVTHNGDSSDERLTLDRKQRIDLALEWLRSQLQEMRSQDQNLAKQLLAIRQDIHKLKLQRSTEEHQELIDDFQFEMQELQEHQEFSDVLDLPPPAYAANPLKHIGVTRLNISSRRFSAC